ncbi:MAG: response regulator [Candidatus Brocadiia bacterium]
MEPQRRVLIVDDDDTLRATLKRIFEKAGYCTRTARNAQEATQTLEAEDVDLVLADLKLPRKDGLSLLDEARSLRPQSKIVIMTAYGTEQTRRDAIQRGAYAYLDKPVSRTDLLDLCHKALAAP